MHRSVCTRNMNVLGGSSETRQFDSAQSLTELERIRTTINEGWLLGSERFTNEIDQALNGESTEAR
jgi:hypothetical protein